MIDDKKIEDAARYYCNNRYPASQDAPFIAEGFRHGAKWAINEFLKNLWHPMKEEPKLVGEEIIIEAFIDDERYTIVQKYMVGEEIPPIIESIRWISDWDSFLAEICDDVKMIRWCYFKDLFPKKEDK